MVRKLIVSVVSLAGLVCVFARSGGSTSKFAGRTPEKHRATAPACDHLRPDTEPSVATGSSAPAACTKNADCTQGENGGGVEGFRCHTDEDECLDDADCTATLDASTFGPSYCMYDGNAGHWKCSNSQCVG